MSIKTKSFLVRFIKGFVGGGLASMVMALQAGVFVQTLSDVKSLGYMLGISFITGALLAIEKMISWQDTVAPVL